jgi:hypothetical protein
MQRPTSLTIIAWLLMVSGAFGVVSNWAMQDNPVMVAMISESPFPAWLHKWLGVLGAFVSLICGYGILKGMNWSRYVYVAFSVIGIGITLVAFGAISLVLLSLVFLAVVVFFLFRPAANAWFTSGSTARAE